MRSAKRLRIKSLQKTQAHPQVLRVFLEAFLTQYISASRFNESLNLGTNKG